MTLKESLETINKTFGKGSAFILGKGEKLAIEVIPMGIPSLDAALRVGGFPRGRIVEIYGVESGGKSTLAMMLIAAAQKLGGQGAIIDIEHSFDPEYGRKLGMDIDNLIISQPDYGEQALEIADALIQSNDLDVVVIDSVAALVPKAELEGDMGQPQIGLQARLMSQALRKLTANVSKSRGILVFINQIRNKIGIVYGNPEVTSGGNALKFYASMRLDVRRKEIIKDGDTPVGALTRVKVVKNKCGSPFGEAELTLIYGEGFSAEADLIEVGVERGVIGKTGNWYDFDVDGKPTKLGNGKEQSRVYLKENPEVFKKIYEAVQKVDK